MVPGHECIFIGDAVLHIFFSTIFHIFFLYIRGPSCKIISNVFCHIQLPFSTWLRGQWRETWSMQSPALHRGLNMLSVSQLNKWYWIKHGRPVSPAHLWNCICSQISSAKCIMLNVPNWPPSSPPAVVTRKLRYSFSLSMSSSNIQKRISIQSTSPPHHGYPWRPLTLNPITSLIHCCYSVPQLYTLFIPSLL